MIDVDNIDLSKKLDEDLYKSLEYMFREAEEDKAALRESSRTANTTAETSPSSLGGPNMFVGIFIGLVLGAATTLTKSGELG